MKLEPPEAQRKAMADLKRAVAWVDMSGTRASLWAVHKAAREVLAANSIPEGAPVGTIARRPDGAIVAVRSVTQKGKPFWAYNYLTTEDDAVFDEDAADSWPVIYDPMDQVAVNPDAGLEFFPPGEEPPVPRPDPTAQQEPGESLARGLDDLAAGRVSRRDDYLEPEDPGYCGNCDGRKCMGCVFREYDHDCADDCPDCCTTARTPRVVDRLGVDEQGSRWQDRQLGEWKFDGQAWRYLELTWTRVPGGEWVEAEPSKRYGPYVEVLS